MSFYFGNHHDICPCCGEDNIKEAQRELGMGRVVNYNRCLNHNCEAVYVLFSDIDDFYKFNM